RPGDVQGHIVGIRKLIQKMTGIRPLVPSSSIVGASHVSPRANPLIRPPVPLPVSIETDRYHRRLNSAPTRDHADRGRQQWPPIAEADKNLNAAASHRNALQPRPPPLLKQSLQLGSGATGPTLSYWE